MLNDSYDMAMQICGTEQDLDEFNQSRQSQSLKPSDWFSQNFEADRNKEHFSLYRFHETLKQHGETPGERRKREKQSDKEPF